MTGKIFDIIYGSLHDGKGIRTVVYLKGCSLKCRWCHNPEGLSKDTQVLFHKNLCIQCSRCIAICPEHHIVQNGELHFVRKDGCTDCIAGAEACPSKALEISGRDMTSDEVLTIILKCKPFYDSSGGGVTFSGGECLLQDEFLAEILKKCKEQKIHTIVETALNVNFDTVKNTYKYVDSFFVDIKCINEDRHKKFTGHDNKKIIENLKYLSLLHPDIVIRIPLIPGVNDDTEELSAISSFINTLGGAIKAVELLRYNNLYASKYEALGYEAEMFSQLPQTNTQIEGIYKIFKKQLNSDIDLVAL